LITRLTTDCAVIAAADLSATNDPNLWQWLMMWHSCSASNESLLEKLLTGYSSAGSMFNLELATGYYSSAGSMFNLEWHSFDDVTHHHKCRISEKPIWTVPFGYSKFARAKQKGEKNPRKSCFEDCFNSLTCRTNLTGTSTNGAGQ